VPRFQQGATSRGNAAAVQAAQSQPAAVSSAGKAGDGTPRANTAPQCKLRRGRQLAEWAIPQVRPTFAALAAGKVALGYAQTTFYAFGVTVDLKMLNATPSFHEYRKQPLFSVIPSYEKDQLLFVTQRQPSDVISGAALSGASQLVVGQTKNGLSLSSAGGHPRQLWPLPSGHTISVPVAAHLENGDFALALRLDGNGGGVQLGLLDDQGKPKGDLAQVQSRATEFGEPGLTVRGNTTALVFAGRKGDEANWNIYAALGKNGALPTEAKPLALGTPNNTNTFIGPLGEKYFLLLYSEKSALESVTKAVVLDEDFKVQGSPIEVSTETQLSSAAALWSGGTEALAVFFVTNGGNTEMWGTSLRCLP
jgi:hypothetical protein